MRQETQGIDVKFPFSHRVVVCVYTRAVVWGIIRACPGSYTNAVLEPCEFIEKSTVISVTPGLVSLPRSGTTYKVPREITDLGDEPICIKPKTSLARISSTSCVERPLPVIKIQHVGKSIDQPNPTTEKTQPSFNKQSNSVDPDLLTVLNLGETPLNDDDDEREKAYDFITSILLPKVL